MSRLQSDSLPEIQKGLVSILIRTTDRASLLESIRSVVEQDFTQWELVIVNASGHPLAHPFTMIDSRIRPTLEPQTALGRSAAANTLLDAARGEYCVFLDDDDVFLPNHLSSLKHLLDARADLVAAYSDVQAICRTQNGEVQQSHLYAQEFNPQKLQFLNYLPIHAVLFRTAITRSSGGCRFTEDLDLFEDWDFWLQAAKHGSFQRVSGVSAIYHLSDTSGSGHTVVDSSRRLEMLLCFSQRLLQRWNKHDVFDLIEWQSAVSSEHIQIEQMCASQAAQIDRARTDIAALNFELVDTRNKELKLMQNVNFLDGQVDELSNKIALLERQILSVQTDLNASQLRNSELEEFNSSLVDKVREHTSAIAAQSRQIEAMQADADHLKSNGFMQRLEIEKLAQVRAQHLLDIEALNAQLLSTYQSTSWKLTRPLRAIKKVGLWAWSPAPWNLLRNAARAARGEYLRHGARRFLQRVPHYARNASRYGAVIASDPPRRTQRIFNETHPVVPSMTRLHPDLTTVKEPIELTISVVIPTFNAGKEFTWLLRKLKSQQGIRSVEIVIVDSGSTDRTVTVARQAGCRVVEITQAEFTHSHSRNLGAANARGDYLLFMVQDAYPIGSFWAYGMLKYVQEHAQENLVAASCSEYSRSDSDIMYDSMIHTHYRFLGCHDRDRNGDLQGFDHMSLRSRGQLSDVSCLISRETFSKYGYRGDYAEDLDLGIRLIKDGYKVAMLSSVKVIHSHNRTPYYYLKRSYVDVIFLVGMFEDFLIPPVESIDGMLVGIASCALHVSQALPQLSAFGNKSVLSTDLSAWIAICRHHCSVVSLKGSTQLGDARLNAYIDKLATQVHSVTLDASVLGEAGRFADSFFARLEHFNSFAKDVFGGTDTHLQNELRDAICKTFAAAAGSALGFMYMDALKKGNHHTPLIASIHTELKAGV